MDTQHVQEKVKANGKWASAQAKDTAKDLSERGSDFLAYVQDNLSDIIKSAGSQIKTAGSQSVTLAKKYPVQAAIGGLVCGFILGAALFRSSRTSV